MALSKAVPPEAVDPFTEISRRFVQPFAELWEDLCGQVEGLAASVHLAEEPGDGAAAPTAPCAEPPAPQPGADGAAALDAERASGSAAAVSLPLFSALSSASPSASASAAASAVRQAARCLSGAFSALEEVASDFAITEPALPAAMALLAASPTPAATSVVLCGLSLGLRVVAAYTGVTLVACAVTMLRKYPDHPNRSMQVRAFVALVSCGCLHLAFALGAFGLVPGLADVALSPEVLLHHALDMIFNPLLLLNIARLSGMSASEVMPAVMSLVVSSMCFMGATVGPVPVTTRLFCLATGASSLGNAVRQVLMLPMRAAEVCSSNGIRVRKSGEFTIVLWLSCPVVHSMLLLGAISASEAFSLFSFLDILGKTSAMHLIFRSRPAIDAVCTPPRRVTAITRGGAITTVRIRQAAPRPSTADFTAGSSQAPMSEPMAEPVPDNER